jgi:hypothetical protein
MRNLGDYGTYYEMSFSVSMSMRIRPTSPPMYPSKSPVQGSSTTNRPISQSRAPITVIAPMSTTAPVPVHVQYSENPTKSPTNETGESIPTMPPAMTPTTNVSNETSYASSEVIGGVRRVASRPATIASLVVGIMALISVFAALVVRKVHHRNSLGRTLLSSVSEGKLLHMNGALLDEVSTASSVTKSALTADYTMEGTMNSSRT